MRHIITGLVLLLSITIAKAQENNLQTESILIDNFISFIADNFHVETQPKPNEIKAAKNTLFLIETTTQNFSDEDKIILQQGFKFLSKRLTKDDTITIIVYSGQNGVLLESTSAKDIKKVLYVLNDVQSGITEKHSDGITLAYKLAQEQFSEATINTLVMVRNPEAINSKRIVEANTLNPTKTKVETKPKNNAVLLTAITLLPELISIIKN